MGNRFGQKWDLVKDSATVLKKNKALTIFPMISFIGFLCLAYIALRIIIGAGSEAGQTEQNRGLNYLLFFLYYIACNLIFTFSNVALVACTIRWMNGENPTITYGLRTAFSKTPLIIQWSILSATVGVALRALENVTSKFFGLSLLRVVGGLGLIFAWGIGSFFVIPILVSEDIGVWSAAQKSYGLFKKTWGDLAISQFGFGIVFAGFYIAIIGLCYILLSSFHPQGGGPLALSIIFGGLSAIVAAGVVSSALANIYRVVLYFYSQGIVMKNGPQISSIPPKI